MDSRRGCKETYIVRSVRVVVHTTEERSRRVAANVLGNQVWTTGVLVDEVRHIVDEASDDNKWAFQRLLLVCDR